MYHNSTLKLMFVVKIIGRQVSLAFPKSCKLEKNFVFAIKECGIAAKYFLFTFFVSKLVYVVKTAKLPCSSFFVLCIKFQVGLVCQQVSTDFFYIFARNRNNSYLRIKTTVLPIKSKKRRFYKLSNVTNIIFLA